MEQQNNNSIIQLKCVCNAPIYVNLQYVDPTKESIIEICKSCNKPNKYPKVIYEELLLKVKNKQTEQQQQYKPFQQTKSDSDKTNIVNNIEDDDKTSISGGQNPTTTIDSPKITYNHFKLVNIDTKDEYFLQKGQKNIIGRNAAISIKTNDAFMSGQHCCIEIIEISGNTKAFLYDDGTGSQKSKPSTNGTFVNEATSRISELQKIILFNGDKIKLGRTHFIFRMY